MLSLTCRLLGGKFRAAGFFIRDSMRRDWRVDMLPQRSIHSHTKANGASDFGRATSLFGREPDIRFAEMDDDRNAQRAAMSGRRPVVKGCFEAVVNVLGAVMSTAC
jgi:hypothetical protein